MSNSSGIITMKPVVFISYCWTNPSHEEWVIYLAERLVNDGVDVKIDKWDLKEGQDKNNFMESMVKSKNIDKVIIILDKKYSEKADSRTGGVGTETQIISDKVYNDVSQEKFIPIVKEKDENGNAYIPVYLNGRIFIDLSSEENFEVNYEKLLRNLYNRPQYTKPKIGVPPKFIFEESVHSKKCSALVRSFDLSISRNPNQINTLLYDFLQVFNKELSEYSIKDIKNQSNIELGKIIVDNINSYTLLRNDYIDFLNKVVGTQLSFDTDILINFFEKLPLFLRPIDNRGSWNSCEFDNFRFIIRELFLYLIGVCLKRDNYILITDFLHSQYFIEDRYQNPNPQGFQVFGHLVTSINDYYNSMFSQTLISPMADLLVKRIHENFTVDELADADLTCFYISFFTNNRWFPITYIYKTTSNFRLVDRLLSKKHFEKVKAIFNVSTPEEFIGKLNEMKQKKIDGYGYSMFRSITPLHNLIDARTLASVR